MFEAKLVIEIPGLEVLAAAIAQRAQTVGAAAGVPAQRHADYGVIPAGQTPPPAQARTTPPAVPPVTAAPTYTHEQVGKAGADLIAASPAKLPELLALLQQFGVPAVAELKPEQLGPFATALRGLGAKI